MGRPSKSEDVFPPRPQVISAEWRLIENRCVLIVKHRHPGPVSKVEIEVGGRISMMKANVHQDQVIETRFALEWRKEIKIKVVSVSRSGCAESDSLMFQSLIPVKPVDPLLLIARWQKARIAACEVGLKHPEYMARLNELAEAEHALMRKLT